MICKNSPPKKMTFPPENRVSPLACAEPAGGEPVEPIERAKGYSPRTFLPLLLVTQISHRTLVNDQKFHDFIVDEAINNGG
jgi:hypothetical protein